MSRRIIRGWQCRTSVLALALLLCASTVLAQDAAQYQELPNFHQVSLKLYRGAQPRDGGLRKLKELGIKTIINLRGEDERTRTQQTEAEALGLRYFSISMPGLRRPSDEKVQRVLALINAGDNQPVFVHCRVGKDRTGLIIAVYRISHDGWTSEQAKREAKHFGMSWVQRGMKDFISDYYRDRMKLHSPPRKSQRLIALHSLAGNLQNAYPFTGS